MPVRLRRKDGSTQTVTNLESIEVTDSEGLLAMVVFTNRRDVIQALIPGDPIFTAYCRAHGLGAARVHRHEQIPVKRNLSD